ncbi:hypothetical protein AGMMS4957_11870 [Bacteroidia bacterium]|nr:hypothetical protein AGMMS4957_11870 [Bacteroidia bacterium]
MSTMELEVQKAGLAREILSETDAVLVQQLCEFLQTHKVKKTKGRRKLGILEGKLFFSEVGDGKITTDEFLGI